MQIFGYAEGVIDVWRPSFRNSSFSFFKLDFVLFKNFVTKREGTWKFYNLMDVISERPLTFYASPWWKIIFLIIFCNAYLFDEWNKSNNICQSWENCPIYIISCCCLFIGLSWVSTLVTIKFYLYPRLVFESKLGGILGSPRKWPLISHKNILKHNNRKSNWTPNHSIDFNNNAHTTFSPRMAHMEK